MSLVSVIVLSCNDAEYIIRCLDSVYGQGFDDIEMIVIDDASDDGTWQLIQDYAREHQAVGRAFNLHRNASRQGSATNRNLGLQMAAGEFLTFVDGDDWIEAHALGDMVAAARNTNADIVASDFIMDRSGSVALQAQALPDDNVLAIERLLTGKLHGSCCNKLYRQSFVERAGVKFIDGADYTEDLAFNVKLLLKDAHTRYCDKAYYHYCVRPTSMSRSAVADKRDVARRDLQKIANVASIEVAIQASPYVSRLNHALRLCQLMARLPLLAYPTREKCRLWRSTFPESNAAILSCRSLPLSYRLELWLLGKGMTSLFLLIYKLKMLRPRK